MGKPSVWEWIFLGIFAITTTLFLILYIVYLLKNEDELNEQKVFQFSGFLGDALLDTGGADQIRCDRGTVHILQANYSVYDPYAQCYNAATVLPGAELNAGCSPAWTGKGHRASGPNFGGDFQCFTKDLTPYLARKCDGKFECAITVDRGYPLPCNLIQDPLGDDSGKYQQLPATPADEELDISEKNGYWMSGSYVCKL